jgi:hypothetical protein
LRTLLEPESKIPKLEKLFGNSEGKKEGESTEEEEGEERE